MNLPFRKEQGARGSRRRGISFYLLGLMTMGLLLVVLAPFGLLIAGSVLPTDWMGITSEQWAGREGDGLISFHWFGYVWELYHESFFFSLRLAVLSTGLGLLIAVPAAKALAVPGDDFSSPIAAIRRGKRLLESLIMLPLAMPGVALSIAIIQAWAVVRGSWGLILGGHVLYTMPFLFRLTRNALAECNAATLEQSARGLGAGGWQRFFWVILPNLRHSLIAGSLMVFAVSWGEFNVSFLLNTPLNQTYPAALYATYTSNSFQVGAAATVIFLAVIVPALIAIQWIGRGTGSENAA